MRFLAYLLWVSILCWPSFAVGSWVVQSVAGNGAPGFRGDYGKADGAQLDNPLSLTRGADGSVWFCEAGDHRVRWIRPDGFVFTFAGTGKKGFDGDGGPALAASLSSPHDLKFDANGDLYIADTGNNAIRKVEMKNKVIRTFAGTGFGGYSGDGDSATIAHLRKPTSIQFGPDGDLYICDMGNHAIRKVDVKTGFITTVAGTGRPGPTPNGSPIQGTAIQSPRCIDFDPAGNLWVSTLHGHQIYKLDLVRNRIVVAAGTGEKGFSGDGGPARCAKLNGPKSLAVDAVGNVWISDTENHVIRRINAATKNIELIAGTGESGDGPEGDPLLCKMSRIHGLLPDKDGSLLVADSENHRIRALRNLQQPAITPAVEVSRKTRGRLSKQTPATAEPPPPVSGEQRGEKAQALAEVKAEAVTTNGDQRTAKTVEVVAKALDERKASDVSGERTRRVEKEPQSANVARDDSRLLVAGPAHAPESRVADKKGAKAKIEAPKQDSERSEYAQKLKNVERAEADLAKRDAELSRKMESFKRQELDRLDQDLVRREEELERRMRALNVKKIESKERELQQREKALAVKLNQLREMEMQRDEQEIMRREKAVELRVKKLALDALESKEQDLANREKELELRLKRLGGK